MLLDPPRNTALVEIGIAATEPLDAGLVDEWIAYLAPVVLGDAARGLFALPALSDMANRVPFRVLDSRTVGSDLRLILRPA